MSIKRLGVKHTTVILNAKLGVHIQLNFSDSNFVTINSPLQPNTFLAKFCINSGFCRQ